MADPPRAGSLSVVVAIPCLDEEAAIGQVVADFRAAVPSASIIVYDNGSRDATAAVAARAGAVVRHESMRGKGHVVRRIFVDMDADVLVLVDGDGTYAAQQAPAMIETLWARGLDMVSGAREAEDGAAWPPGHRFGNAAITALIGWVFGRRFGDTLSGYRVFSQRFVKSFPAHSRGFEIETELAVHALEMRLPCVEIATPYRARSDGSRSKLRTVRDGAVILWTIGRLAREGRPLACFSGAFAVLELAAVALAWPLLPEYLESGLVPRLPTALLALGLALLGCGSLVCGLILDAVTIGRREARRFFYLALPGLPARSPAGFTEPAGKAADGAAPSDDAPSVEAR